MEEEVVFLISRGKFQVGVVSIVIRVRAERPGFRILTRVWHLCLQRNLDTVSGASPASYSVGVAGSFPVLNRLSRNTKYSSVSSAEGKNKWQAYQILNFNLRVTCSAITLTEFVVWHVFPNEYVSRQTPQIGDPPFVNYICDIQRYQFKQLVH
jgi:hypothetical protein